MLKQLLNKIALIYRDHLSEPLHSIYQELVKGRADVTDRKARIDAIESLKRMIRAWLDENYPKMNAKERASRAEAMDISLIEQHMEGEILDILRLSLQVTPTAHFPRYFRIHQIYL